MHPARTKKLDELNIYRSFTIDEAINLVDGNGKRYTSLNILHKKILLLRADDRILEFQQLTQTPEIHTISEIGRHTSRF